MNEQQDAGKQLAPERLYVLTTDPRMPSKGNLWGTQAGSSLEDATARFKARITGYYSSNDTGHLGRMMHDRDRRLREDDFTVELG
jgi:hypothetical protein